MDYFKSELNIIIIKLTYLMFIFLEQPVPLVNLHKVFRILNDILGNTPIILQVNTREMLRLVISMNELDANTYFIGSDEDDETMSEVYYQMYLTVNDL